MNLPGKTAEQFLHAGRQCAGFDIAGIELGQHLHTDQRSAGLDDAVIPQDPVKQQKHHFRHDIGYGQEFKINIDCLLHSPDTDIQQHRHHQEHGKLRRSQPLFDPGMDDNANHGQHVSQKIHGVEGMKRAIVFDQPGHAVDRGDLHTAVIQTHPVAAGGQEKCRRTDGDEQHSSPLQLSHQTHIGNDQQHGQHRIGRAEIGNAVGDHGHGQRGRSRQQEVAAVGCRHTAGQQEEFPLPLLLPEEIEYQKEHRQHCHRSIYHC